jgi:hypothetical protein
MTGLQAAAIGTSKAGIAANKELAMFGLHATDSTGKITPLADIIDGLAPKYANMTQAQQLATSSIIFGTSAAKQMTAVIDAGSQSFNNSVSAVAKQGSAQAAAAKQGQTLAVQFKTIKATVVDVAAQMGSVLVPALSMVFKFVTPVIGAFVSLASKITANKTALMIFVGFITALFIPTIASAVGSLATMTAGFVADAAAAVVSFGETIYLVGLMAADFIVEAAAAAAAWIATLGPIALIVAGIAALIAIIVLVITHFHDIEHWFDEFRHTVAHVFDEVRHDIAAAFDWIVEKFIWFEMIPIMIFEKIRHEIANVFDGVRHEAAHLVDDVVGFFESLPMRVIHFIENAAKGVLNAFLSWIPGGGIIGGAFSAIGLATGGIVTKPTLAVVGEAGPEAVVPLKGFGSAVSAIVGGGQVSPLPSLGSSIGATSNAVVGQPGNIINITTVARDPHEIASELGWLSMTGQL